MTTSPARVLCSIVLLLGCSSGGGIQAPDGGGNDARPDGGGNDAHPDGGAEAHPDGGGDGGAEAGGDTAVACAASGQSCAASNCCQDPSESCLAQGTDRLCLHAQPPPREGPACNGAASSTLAGVTIAFPDDRCSFTPAELAAGIIIRYQVVATANVTGVIARPLDAGGCGRATDASGLIPFGDLAGQGQRYCLCDVGLCPAASAATTVVAGTYPREFPWDGKNWLGPSDTGNPRGAAFPAGTYTFTARATGTKDGTAFEVRATRFITVEP